MRKDYAFILILAAFFAGYSICSYSVLKIETVAVEVVR